MAAFFLKRAYDLSDESAVTVTKAIDALGIKLLNAQIGDDTHLTKKQLKQQLPAQLPKASRSGKDGLEQARFQEFLGKFAAVPELRREEESTFDLTAFAATVQAATRDMQTGRFGDNKVFISHDWNPLREEPSFPRLDLDQFKRRLIEANQAGLLRLSRADLVEAMNPADEAASQTTDLNAEFHFILVERSQP